MSDERAFDERDIAFVKEHLSALDAQISVPDTVSSEKLLEKMNSAPKKRGKILSFRTVSTVAAALIVIAVLTVAWRGLFPTGYMAPRMMAAGSAENGTEEEAAVQAPAEAPAPAPEEAESYSVAVTDESGETEAALETDKMEPFSQDVDDYSAVREALEGLVEGGYSESAGAQWADEDSVETKYRLADIEDDGGSVSVLIYDKENGNELFAALWVQGDYFGAQQSEDGRTLTVTTRMKAEEGDLESGEFIPVYSDESGSPVRIPAENITIKEVCKEPVYAVTTTIDLESGSYTVTAVLG